MDKSSYTTDYIQMEAARIKNAEQNFISELERIAHQYNMLQREVKALCGGQIIYTCVTGEVVISVPLEKMPMHYEIINRNDSTFPFMARAKTDFIEMLHLFKPEEWAEFAKDNQVCIECGRDFEFVREWDGVEAWRCPNLEC